MPVTSIYHINLVGKPFLCFSSPSTQHQFRYKLNPLSLLLCCIGQLREGSRLVFNDVIPLYIPVVARVYRGGETVDIKSERKQGREI